MVVADRLSSDSGTASAATSPTSTPAAGGVAGEGAAPAPSTSVDAATAELQELDAGAASAAPAAAVTGDCVIEVRSLRVGATGNSVTCLQKALADAGLYAGPQNGTFDNATYVAVRKAQEARNLFVDGLVGRETALALDVWPDEASLVVHTPAPAPGAVDLLGYPLSLVATSGPDAPPLPANSGQRTGEWSTTAPVNGSGRSTRTSESFVRGSSPAASTTTRCPARTRCSAAARCRRRGTARRSCRG